MLNGFFDYFPKTNYSHNNTLIAFRVEDEFGFPIRDYEKYMSINTSFDHNFIERDGGYLSNTTELKFNRCTNNSKFGHLFTSSAENYFCIDNYDLEIGGIYGSSDEVNFIRIKVDICQNTTQNNNSCLKIHKSNNYYFNVYISDANIGLMDKENSLKYKLNNFYTLIDPKVYKFSEFKYSMVDIVTDSGFFVKSIDNSSGLFLDIINSDFSTVDKNETTAVECYFYLSNKKQSILRSYIKLQDIGAQIGGITQILILIFSLLIEPLLEKKVNFKLINHLFKFSKPELRIKTSFDKIQYKGDSLNKRRINSLNVSKSKSFALQESNDKALFSFREKINLEKIQGIIDELKNLNDLKYTKCEMILSTYFCKFFHSSKIKKLDLLTQKSVNHLNKFLNINSLFDKLIEFDIIKFLLLSKEQIKTLNFIDKPELCVHEGKLGAPIFMKITDNSEEINKELVIGIIEYYLKNYKQSPKSLNSIDSKLFELLPSKLKDIIISLNL